MLSLAATRAQRNYNLEEASSHSDANGIEILPSAIPDVPKPL